MSSPAASTSTLPDAEPSAEAGSSSSSVPYKSTKALPTLTLPPTSKTLLKPRKKTGPSPGIIYISRIPPGMTPHKIKHLMSRWGETGKVFAQKDESGPSKGKATHSVNYTEAWIEFVDKAVAKSAALMLNAQTIGGHKGEKWRDDIWTMKYLPGFKWTMLGEQMAYERNSHNARLRQELSKSKAEQAEYLQNVELARVLDKRRERKVAAGQDPTLRKPKADGGEDKDEGGKKREREEDGGDKRKKRKLKAVTAKRQEGEKRLEDVLGSVF